MIIGAFASLDRTTAHLNFEQKIMIKEVLASFFVISLMTSTSAIADDNRRDHCIRGEPSQDDKWFRFFNSCNHSVSVMYCYNDGEGNNLSCGSDESYFQGLKWVGANSSGQVFNQGRPVQWRVCLYPQHKDDGVNFICK